MKRKMTSGSVSRLVDESVLKVKFIEDCYKMMIVL